MSLPWKIQQVNWVNSAPAGLCFTSFERYSSSFSQPPPHPPTGPEPHGRQPDLKPPIKLGCSCGPDHRTMIDREFLATGRHQRPPEIAVRPSKGAFCIRSPKKPNTSASQVETLRWTKSWPSAAVFPTGG